MHKQASARVEKKSGKIRSGSTPRPRKFPALQQKEKKEDVPRRGLHIPVEELIQKSSLHLSRLGVLDGLTAPKRGERKESCDEFIEVQTEAAARRQAFRDSLAGSLMRSLFKADHPYRTKLGFSGNFATNTAGLMNQVYTPAQLSTVVEWAAIDALFDEFFLHSVTISCRPLNRAGGGVATVGSAFGTPTFTPASAQVNSCGLMCASLFGTSPTYSSAGAMIANPSLKIVMSDAPWQYSWRNNVRFDPHGVALDVGTTTLGWQGWADVTSTAKYGGSIQVRAINDRTLGTGATTLTVGDFNIFYDVSFRSRA